MPNPVTLATVHHEGAGTPTNDPRGAAGGYTYWLGPSTWTRLRDVWSSFATLGFNHISLDVCISGDRSALPLTELELSNMQAVFVDAHNRSEVTANPMVRAHHFSPGSNTVCPGVAIWNDAIMWGKVVGCFVIPAPTPQPRKDNDVNVVYLPGDKYLELDVNGGPSGRGAINTNGARIGWDANNGDDAPLGGSGKIKTIGIPGSEQINAFVVTDATTPLDTRRRIAAITETGTIWKGVAHV